MSAGTSLARVFGSLASWSERFSAEERASFAHASRAVERELPDSAVVIICGPEHDPTLNALDECASVLRRLRDDLAVIEDRLTAIARHVPTPAEVEHHD